MHSVCYAMLTRTRGAMQTDSVDSAAGLYQLRVNEAVGLFIIVGIIMLLAWIIFLFSEYRHGFRSFNKNELRRVHTVNQQTRQKVCRRLCLKVIVLEL